MVGGGKDAREHGGRWCGPMGGGGDRGVIFRIFLILVPITPFSPLVPQMGGIWVENPGFSLILVEKLGFSPQDPPPGP